MVEMVTPRNDSIELSVVKEKQRPLPSAPPGEYFNGNTLELGRKVKRPPAPRKRCWTVVTLVVVVLVAIGAGTIVFYEHLTGRLPAESSNGYGPLPEVSTDSSVVTERVPGLSDPFPEESSSQRSMPSTTEVIFIDSTTEDEYDKGPIYIDSKEESVENSSVDRTTSEEPYEETGSGDVSDRDPTESSEEKSYDEGSGSGAGDDSEG